MPVIGGEVIGPFDIRYYGCKVDGSTDDTTAFNAAIAAVLTAGGGTLYVPRGICKLNGQILIPNDGLTDPSQKPLRITGVGCNAQSTHSTAGYVGTGGSVLDMRYSGTVAKVQSLGAGQLEIDHLSLIDGGTDTTPFIFVTNTILKLHHVTIIGTNQGSQGVQGQDAIICGGTTGSLDGTTSAGFQGYGTVIDSCFFNYISRMVYLRAFANAIQVTNNTLWAQSAGVSAIELDGTGSQGASCYGNYFAGNLLEITNFQYAVTMNTASRNVFSGNGFWDYNGGFLGYFNLTNSFNNVMLMGYYDSTPPIFTGDSSATAMQNVQIGGFGGGGVGSVAGFVQRYSSSTGNPNGVVTAPVGSLLCDTVGGNLWVKNSGTGNTGWKVATIT